MGPASNTIRHKKQGGIRSDRAGSDRLGSDRSAPRGATEESSRSFRPYCPPGRGRYTFPANGLRDAQAVCPHGDVSLWQDFAQSENAEISAPRVVIQRRGRGRGRGRERGGGRRRAGRRDRTVHRQFV